MYSSVRKKKGRKYIFIIYIGISQNKIMLKAFYKCLITKEKWKITWKAILKYLQIELLCKEINKHFIRLSFLLTPKHIFHYTFYILRWSIVVLGFLFYLFPFPHIFPIFFFQFQWKLSIVFFLSFIHNHNNKNFQSLS